VLACSWWSLEGLLAAAQNWPISYQKVLKKHLLSLLAFLRTLKELVGILVEPLLKLGNEFIMP
jgi:hypothetical protein